MSLYIVNVEFLERIIIANELTPVCAYLPPYRANHVVRKVTVKIMNSSLKKLVIYISNKVSKESDRIPRRQLLLSN